MKYCKTCVMPESKPGIVLDELGRCNACVTSIEKKKVDWENRWNELKLFSENAKRLSGQKYDCIVPVSGGKDSWFQTLIMAKELGLKVLCVSLGAHMPTEEGIFNLNKMIDDLDIDIIKIMLKPSSYRKIRKKCFLKQGEPNWAEHCAMFSCVLNVALLYEVPLIAWGEDIAYEFGGLQTNKSTPSAITINKNDLIKSKSIQDWLDNDISPRDTFFYTYPDYEKLEKANIKSIYLGHFIPWYGRRHYDIVKKRGFLERKKGPLSGNHLDYDNIDEKLCEINIWFKYIKFGFWRSTDQCCYDIWNDHLTREKAVEIVNNLSKQFPEEYFKDFLNFHMITEEQFWETVEKFRNQDVWEEVKGEWVLKFPLT